MNLISKDAPITPLARQWANKKNLDIFDLGQVILDCLADFEAMGDHCLEMKYKAILSEEKTKLILKIKYYFNDKSGIVEYLIGLDRKRKLKTSMKKTETTFKFARANMTQCFRFAHPKKTGYIFDDKVANKWYFVETKNLHTEIETSTFLGMIYALNYFCTEFYHNPKRAPIMIEISPDAIPEKLLVGELF